MKRIQNIIGLAFLIALLSCGAKSQSELGADWKETGKITPRHARDITASNLWVGGETLDRDYASYEEYKKYLGPLGAKKLRLQSGWAKTEKVKGVYDFKWLDAIVDDAISQGVQPWLQISYGNPIYEGAGTVDLGGGIPHGEEGLAAWENYARALVTHFKDRVSEWEVWNEPDLGQNKTKPELYSELFYRTGKIIRELQPEATIVALSIAHMDINYVTAFLDFLKERDALSFIDAVSFHGYPMIPESTFDGLRKYQECIWGYKPGVKFWQGETGCPSTKGSSGALGNHDWTELTQAKWNLRRAMSHIGRDIPFSMFLLCEFSYLNHPGYVNRSKLNTKGLLKIDEKTMAVVHAKEAYYAYQNLCALFTSDAIPEKDFSYSSELDAGELAVFGFKSGKKNVHAVTVWLGSQIPSDTNDYRQTTITFDRLQVKKPVYVDVRTGKVYSIPKKFFKNENGKTKVTVPLYDSPCVITDASFIE